MGTNKFERRKRERGRRRRRGKVCIVKERLKKKIEFLNVNIFERERNEGMEQ